MWALRLLGSRTTLAGRRTKCRVIRHRCWRKYFPLRFWLLFKCFIFLRIDANHSLEMYRVIYTIPVCRYIIIICDSRVVGIENLRGGSDIFFFFYFLPNVFSVHIHTDTNKITSSVVSIIDSGILRFNLCSLSCKLSSIFNLSTRAS